MATTNSMIGQRCSTNDYLVRRVLGDSGRGGGWSCLRTPRQTTTTLNLVLIQHPLTMFAGGACYDDRGASRFFCGSSIWDLSQKNLIWTPKKLQPDEKTLGLGTRRESRKKSTCFRRFWGTVSPVIPKTKYPESATSIIARVWNSAHRRQKLDWRAPLFDSSKRGRFQVIVLRLPTTG